MMSSERDQKIVVQLHRTVHQSVMVGTDYKKFVDTEAFFDKVLQEALDKAVELPENHWKTEEVEKDAMAIIHHKDGVVIV
jgi:hypothetical protein